MVRERNYEDSELARRLEEWLKDYFKGMNINSSRESNRVFFSSQGIEYAAVFCQESGKGMFQFHVENPADDLVSDMRESLADDSIYETNDVLSRPKYKDKLSDYRKVFKREYVKKGELYAQNKKIETSVSAVSVKEVPLGAEGRLSSNFMQWAFDYNMRPVILLAQKHKFMR
jgi:hypothetical protein